MIVPDGARLQARITGRTYSAVFGGAVGFLVGLVVTFNHSPASMRSAQSKTRRLS